MSFDPARRPAHPGHNPPRLAGPGRGRYSVVVPVYDNEPTIPPQSSSGSAHLRLGSTTRSKWSSWSTVRRTALSPLLRRLLEELRPRFEAQLIALSRNFGSFSAIRAGLAAAEGDFVAIMAADLQEPIELVRDFFAALSGGECDVAVGVRASRSDPPQPDDARIARVLEAGPPQPRAARAAERGRRCVCLHAPGSEPPDSPPRSPTQQPHRPPLWVGFRRIEVPYERRQRTEGKSGWRLRRKLRYLFDSLFSFTDIPIMAITRDRTDRRGGQRGRRPRGIRGVARRRDSKVAGYTPLMLAIVFTASSILVSLGVIGSFVWRTYENTKGRPGAIPMTHEHFGGDEAEG